MIRTFTADNYDDLVSSLAAGGSSPSSVSLVCEYVATSAVGELESLQAARRQQFGDDVATQTVVVADGVVPVRLSATVADESVVFLPSVAPVDESGNLVGAGDLVAQTQAAFDNAARQLAAVGLGPENIVMTVDYLTFGGLKQYKGTGAVRKAMLSSPYPGSAGIIMDRMADPEALMGLDVIASREPLTGVNPGWERYGKLTYLPALWAGDNLFMSGQAALDPVTETALHDGDLAAQTRYTYQNIVTVLEAAGLGPDALVASVEYVTPAGMDQRADVAAARREVLGDHEPVIVELACAGLLRREFQLEVIPIAAR